MKVVLIGDGNTGKLVKSVVDERGHELVEVFNEDHPLPDAGELPKASFIDFSVAAITVENVRRCAESGNNLVIGTTGWYDKIDTVRDLVEKSGIGCLYAPNFSLGVNLFFRLAREAGRLFGNADYDVNIVEEHHTGKADSPSGTALELGNILLDEMSGKSELLKGNSPGKIGAEQLQISSARLGDVFGRHQIAFEGIFDSLRLTHNVKSRKTFAEGAVKSAEWLRDKQGFFNIHNYVDSMTQNGG